MGVISEYVRGQPAPALRQFIAGYQGYRYAGGPPAVHRGLPSPYLTLIFTLTEPLTVAAHADPRQPPGSFPTLLGGLHASPALITHDGRQSGIQLALRPAAARTLLGLPASELAWIDVDAAAVLGPAAAEIHDRIRAAGSWPDRFAAIDQVLLRRLAAGPGSGPGPGPWPGSALGPEVGLAWRELLRSRGRVPVSRLAAAAGWSERHLRSRFLAETGLTPKAAARVIRFDRARRLMQRRWAGGELVLARLAADCGYYDQAHLAREFRALAGCAPSTWLAEEFRNVQAAGAARVPGSPYE